MPHKFPYHIGDHIIFIEDNSQQEIRGVIRYLGNYPDFLMIKVELDDGSGYYDAKLRKR